MPRSKLDWGQWWEFPWRVPQTSVSSVDICWYRWFQKLVSWGSAWKHFSSCKVCGQAETFQNMMNPDHSLRWWLRPSSSLQSVSACSRLRIQCFSVGMLHYKIISWWWLIGEGLLLKHLKKILQPSPLIQVVSQMLWKRCQNVHPCEPSTARHVQMPRALPKTRWEPLLRTDGTQVTQPYAALKGGEMMWELTGEVGRPLWWGREWCIVACIVASPAWQPWQVEEENRSEIGPDYMKPTSLCQARDFQKWGYPQMDGW